MSTKETIDDSNGFNSLLSRRDMLKYLGMATASGVLNLSLLKELQALTLATQPKEIRPNIIFILSDNCRWDHLGFKKHPFIQTPGIDRLAREGVVFENAFNTTSLCSPSRASILTGTYAHTHGVKNNHTAWTGSKTTFLEYLKQAGYDTAFIGKWHMPGKGLPEMPFLDQFVSYTYREGQGSYFDCPMLVNGKPVQAQNYITREVTDYAIAFMQRNRMNPDGSKRPFCIYLSHRSAHPPYKTPADIKGMYANAKVDLPPEVDAWFSKAEGNVFQGIMTSSYENQYRKYCEVITVMDRDIQRLLDKIEDLGLRENTLVIYASDNGMLWGEHRMHGIREAYEESLRVPFIVRCPWLIRDPGGRRSQMALNIDIAPTILDLAGIPVPKDMEGISLAPTLGNAAVPGRNAFLVEFWKYFPENTPTYVGVRTQTHKYVEFEKGRIPWLFDLTADPRERINLYNTPEANKLLPELKSMLKGLQEGKRY